MSNPTKNEVVFQPAQLTDASYWRGPHFTTPDDDTSKGNEKGPRNTVNQSDRQKDAGLNASDGINRASTWGAEGKAFTPDKNSKSSEDESQTFAGDRDSSVSVNLTSGQIESITNPRTVNGKTLRDVKANRL
jgi:hypothetical protein